MMRHDQKTLLPAWTFMAAVLSAHTPAVPGQNLDEIFNQVNPSVIVVRSKGRDINSGGLVRFNETGSGFLISERGKRGRDRGGSRAGANRLVGRGR